MATIQNLGVIPSPPAELQMKVGGTSDFGPAEQAEHLARLRHLGIKATDDVLDVGCGVGRVAVSLVPYLTGQYRGFDLDGELIAWCHKEITPQYPNFQFTHLDIFNSEVNPKGKLHASDIVFPYDDEQFDFCVLYSVFTHILQRGFERYCSEISRCLKPGGTVMATFFLLNEDSLRQVAETPCELSDRLLEQDGVCRSGLEAVEHFVAYDEEFVCGVCASNHLEIEKIEHGTWMQLVDGTSRGHQDRLVAHKQQLQNAGPPRTIRGR